MSFYVLWPIKEPAAFDDRFRRIVGRGPFDSEDDAKKQAEECVRAGQEGVLLIESARTLSAYSFIKWESR